ncbi:MAG: peptidyl-prolyl cis-trans isomerase [Alistipes sp.]|jgi:hypothetical protein|nr:peptidyl-prolyl cis-trans isomerase [Alistipes sp.]
MKIFVKITIIAMAFAASSCRETAIIFGPEPVARVGRKTLSTEEVAAALPKGISGTDSINYVETFVERWIVRQLKLQEAELIFSSSEADIDRMVEEYRQSLLIRKVEQHYLDTQMDGELTEQDIEQYYNSHKNDFRLSAPVVKGYIVAFPDQYRRREWLLSMMRSPKPEMVKDFEQVCLKNNFRLTKFDEWSDFTEFKSNLPLLRSASHDELLSDRTVRQIHHDRTYYCFRITDALKAGDTMPLFMARDNIVRILTKRRQEEIIRREEERMVGNAEQNGIIKRYGMSEEEPIEVPKVNETKIEKCDSTAISNNEKQITK